MFTTHLVMFSFFLGASDGGPVAEAVGAGWVDAIGVYVPGAVAVGCYVPGASVIGCYVPGAEAIGVRP